MDDNRYDEIMRELDSLQEELESRHSAGISGIRGAADVELTRNIEFENEFEDPEDHYDEIQEAMEFDDQDFDNFEEVHVRRKIVFDNEYTEPERYEPSIVMSSKGYEPDEVESSFNYFKSAYGTIRGNQRLPDEDFQGDEQAPEFGDVNGNMYFDNAQFGDGVFPTEDPRGSQSSIMDEFQNVDSGISNVQVTNFNEDFLSPFRHYHDELNHHDNLREDARHKENAHLLSSILRVSANGIEKGEKTLANTLRLQYDLFMRHPIWNSLMGLQKYLIGPAFRLMSGVLFGFKNSKSTDELILQSIEQQTEFLMTGEIGGRGFFQSLMERGIVGNAISAISYPLLKSVGISKADAQRREDARGRGEEVNSSLLSLSGIAGRLADSLGSGDITRRGRNGLGTQEEGKYESFIERMTDKLFKKDELPDIHIPDSVFPDDIYDSKDGIEKQIDKLDEIHIKSVGSVVIDDGQLVLPPLFNNMFSNLFSDDMFKDKEIILEGPVADNDTSSIISKSKQEFEDEGFDNEDPVKDILEELNDRKILNSDDFKSEGVGVKLDESNHLDRIDSEVDNLRHTKQEDAWTEEQTYRGDTTGLMTDIRKYAKKTAKETEDIRQQGTMRMLLGIGAALISGIGAVVAGVASIGGAIVSAISALSFGGLLGKGKDLIGDVFGGRSRRRRNGRDNDNDDNDSRAGDKTKFLKRVGGVVSAVLAVNEAKDIWTDEEATTGEKLHESTELAGGVVGGVAGAKLGAAGGAALGATIGSVIPVLGTAIGGTIGGLLGGVVGGAAGYFGGSAIGDTVGSVFSGSDEPEIEESSGIPVMTIPSSKDSDASLMERLRSTTVTPYVPEPEPEEEPEESAIGKAVTNVKEKYVNTRSDIREKLDGVSIKEMNLGDTKDEIGGLLTSTKQVGVDLLTMRDEVRSKFDDVKLEGIPSTGDMIQSGRTKLYEKGILNTDNDPQLMIEKGITNIKGHLGGDSIWGRNKEEPVEEENVISGILKNTMMGVGGFVNNIIDNPILQDSNPPEKSPMERFGILEGFNPFGNSKNRSATDSIENPHENKEENPIVAIQSPMNNLSLQAMIAENTLNMSETSEIGNGYLKNIHKTLGDMLKIQQLLASAEPTDDNSGVISSMKNFLLGS